MDHPRTCLGMNHIVVKRMMKYADFTNDVFKYNETETSRFGRILEWADERVRWDRQEQKLNFEGFPYWYQVDQAKFAAEVEPDLIAYLERTKKYLVTLLTEKLVEFKRKRGVDPVKIVVPAPIQRLLWLSDKDTKSPWRCNPLSIAMVQAEYNDKFEIYSSDEDGVFWRLDPKGKDIAYETLIAL